MRTTIRFVVNVLALSLVVVLLGASVNRAQAQATSVTVSIQAPDWQVVALTDLVDIATLTLKPTVSNFGIFLTPVPLGTLTRVYLELELLWQLAGDRAPSRLFLTKTGLFNLEGSRLIVAQDLQRGGELAPTTQFNTEQENRLKNLSTAYAPPGDYIFRVRVFDPNGRLLGSGEHISTVVSTSTNLPITVIEPQSGTTVYTLNPTVSWTSDVPQVKVCFVEMRGRSAEEAILDPKQHCEILQGLTTYTFPVNASFRLEPGQTYYVIISPLVQTAAGLVDGPPAVAWFRTMDDPIMVLLEQFFATAGPDAAGSFETLKGMGFSPSELVHNGRTISLEELRTLLSQLSQLGAATAANPGGFRVTIE